MSKKLFDIKIDCENKNNVVLAKGCFGNEDLQDEEKYLNIILDSLVSKHKEFTFTLNNSDDFPNHIVTILPLESFSVRFEFTPGLYYDVDRGDFLTFPSETRINILNKNKQDSLIKQHKIYYYPKIKKEQGKNKYIIKATLEDHYNIEIYADTEADALQKAYNVPLPEWNHEEINDKPEKTKLIRWSKWGNFKINLSN
jgi:hypothetical protein